MSEFRWFGGQANAMGAGLEDMEVKGNFGSLQGGCEEQRIFDGHRGIGSRVPQKAGGGARSDLKLIRQEPDQGGIGLLAQEIFLRSRVSKFPETNDWIAQDSQIRSATLALDGVRRVRLALIPMGDGGGGEVSAGTAAHDSHAFCIYPKIARPLADHSDGPIDIIEHGRMLIAVISKAILQDEARHAFLGEEKGIVDSFVWCQMTITATGTDDDGGARSDGGVREKRGERGNIIGTRAERAGGAFGPERKGIFHFGSGERGSRRGDG